MSNTQHGHRRTSSALKSLNLKAQHPSQLISVSSPKSQKNLGKKRPIYLESREESMDDESDMSFLQYCPACEKQIFVPNNSILYCSESCRRKDALSTSPTVALTPSNSLPGGDSATARSILPHREPSVFASFVSKPPQLHDFKADLDPTEWKPDSGVHNRTKSEAFNYLSQFHRSSATFIPTRYSILQSRPSAPVMPLVSRASLGLCHTPAASYKTSVSSSSDSSFLRTQDTRSAATPQSQMSYYTTPVTTAKLVHMNESDAQRNC